MKEIKLSKGYETIVDDEDFDYLNQWKWNFSQGYARRQCEKNIYMHRVVNKTPDGFITDHINRNSLDNRKENLRTVKKIDNQRNHKLMKHNTSGYNGVSWSKVMNKWEVFIWLKNKKINIGYFKDILVAVDHRKLAELKYWL